MEKARLVVELIGAICALVPTLVSVFLLIKNIIKNKNWTLVQAIAKKAMSEVEEYAKAHPTMTGKEKFEMAMKAIEAGLAEAGIKFDAALAERIKAYIEDMCKWSKTVN